MNIRRCRNSACSAQRDSHDTPDVSVPRRLPRRGVLGMPFLFEQPNLGKPDENHLYFDPGDGRLITVFTNESLTDAKRAAPRDIGCVEHIAFSVSRATFLLAPARLQEHSIEFIQRDRGFRTRSACRIRTA